MIQHHLLLAQRLLFLLHFHFGNGPVGMFVRWSLEKELGLEWSECAHRRLVRLRGGLQHLGPSTGDARIVQVQR